MRSKASPHPGGVNRAHAPGIVYVFCLYCFSRTHPQCRAVRMFEVRAMPQAGHIVATWADTGKLHMLQPRFPPSNSNRTFWKQAGFVGEPSLPRWNLDAHRKALDKGDKAPMSTRVKHQCSHTQWNSDLYIHRRSPTCLCTLYITCGYFGSSHRLIASA